MSIYNILGYILISLPFIGVVIFVVRQVGNIGWKPYLIFALIFAGVPTLIIVGSRLIALP